MLAEAGLLPLWLHTYAAFNPTGKVDEKLVTDFSLGKTKNDARRAMLSLKAGLHARISTPINEVIIENLACKIIQLETRRNSPVYDIHYVDAPVLRRNAEGDGILLSTADGHDIDLEEGSLMNRWPFGGEVLSMSEIAHRLGLPPTLSIPRAFLVVGSNPMPEQSRERLTTTAAPFQIPSWH
jgi:hypothetical protein